MESQRILLRKWSPGDYSSLAKNLNDKETAFGLGTKYPYSEQDAKCYIEDAISKNKEKYAIVFKENGEIIGGCGIHLFENRASTNIWIAKSYRHIGLGTEALRLLSSYCFSKYKVDRIENIFFSENLASQKMQEKIGVVVQTQEEPTVVNGEPRIKKFGILTKIELK